MRHAALTLVLACSICLPGCQGQLSQDGSHLSMSSRSTSTASSVSSAASSEQAQARSEHGQPLTSVDLPMFMYHYIEPIRNPSDTLRVGLTVTPEEFERQIKAMKDAGVTFLTVADVPEILAGTVPLPKKPVILTVDDGYRDFYEDALPILQKYQAKASLYVIHNRLDTKDYLTTPQLREVIASGLVEVGSHTVSHPDLRTVSLAQQRVEILDSKRLLEEDFGITITTFAYPLGRWDEGALSLAKEGYRAAITVQPGRELRADQLHLLPRLRPERLAGRGLDAFLASLEP